MKESNYFESQRVYNEINEILCDAEAVVKNKSAPKHIWKIYQRILEYECISEELKEHLYDISSEIPSTLSNTNVGTSQTLLNIDNAEGLLEVCNGAYENILNLLKQSKIFLLITVPLVVYCKTIFPCKFSFIKSSKNFT